MNLKESLRDSVLRRTISKKELQRLTGLLQFATKVVRPGRPFLRRLYAMQEIGSHPNHFIRLNLPARADIMWWYIFMEEWNGVSLLWDLGLQVPNLQVYTDVPLVHGVVGLSLILCGFRWSGHRGFIHGLSQ